MFALVLTLDSQKLERGKRKQRGFREWDTKKQHSRFLYRFQFYLWNTYKTCMLNTNNRFCHYQRKRKKVFELVWYKGKNNSSWNSKVTSQRAAVAFPSFIYCSTTEQMFNFFCFKYMKLYQVPQSDNNLQYYHDTKSCLGAAASWQWERPSSIRLNIPSQMGYLHTKGCVFSSDLQMASAVGLGAA